MGKPRKPRPPSQIPSSKSHLELYPGIGIALAFLQWVLPLWPSVRMVVWAVIWWLLLFPVRHSAWKRWTRVRRVITSVFVTAIIAVLAWLSWPPIVTIHPEQFLLYTEGWSNTTSLVVTNSSDKPVYSVWVEIWSETPGVAADKDIEFRIDDNPNAIILGNDRVKFNTDVFALFVVGPRKAIWLRFYELLPGHLRHIFVTGKAKMNSTGSARIVDFKYQPEPLIQR